MVEAGQARAAVVELGQQIAQKMEVHKRETVAVLEEERQKIGREMEEKLTGVKEDLKGELREELGSGNVEEAARIAAGAVDKLQQQMKGELETLKEQTRASVEEVKATARQAGQGVRALGGRVDQLQQNVRALAEQQRDMGRVIDEKMRGLGASLLRDAEFQRMLGEFLKGSSQDGVVARVLEQVIAKIKSDGDLQSALRGRDGPDLKRVVDATVGRLIGQDPAHAADAKKLSDALMAQLAANEAFIAAIGRKVGPGDVETQLTQVGMRVQNLETRMGTQERTTRDHGGRIGNLEKEMGEIRGEVSEIGDELARKGLVTSGAAAAKVRAEMEEKTIGEIEQLLKKMGAEFEDLDVGFAKLQSYSDGYGAKQFLKDMGKWPGSFSSKKLDDLLDVIDNPYLLAALVANGRPERKDYRAPVSAAGKRRGGTIDATNGIYYYPSGTDNISVIFLPNGTASVNPRGESAAASSVSCSRLGKPPKAPDWPDYTAWTTYYGCNCAHNELTSDTNGWVKFAGSSSAYGSQELRARIEARRQSRQSSGSSGPKTGGGIQRMRDIIRGNQVVYLSLR
jgi:hypothetical protein